MQDGAMSQDGKLGEVQVRVLVHQMLEAVVYLHSKSICHRDVKPHNLFLNGHIASTSVQVKLGDFGAAVRLPKDKLLKDPVGTPAFMAPEIHLLPNKSFGYDHKCDVWSIGVCMIFLLVNEYPFFNGRGRLLRERLIKGGAPLWETNSFQNLFQGFQQAAGIASKRPSKLARDLTRLLLTPCPQDRPSSYVAFQHEWFTSPILDTDFDYQPLLDMKDFQEGFEKIRGGVDRDIGWMMNAISNVQIGKAGNHQASQPHNQPLLALQRGLSDITNLFSPSKLDGSMVSAPQRDDVRWKQPVASTSSLVKRHTGVVNGVHGGPHMCCLCHREGSMLDHICPCCGALVCIDCICYRLPKHDLRCPSCFDTDWASESMRFRLGAHEAKQSVGNLWESIVGSLGGEIHQSSRHQSSCYQHGASSVLI